MHMYARIYFLSFTSKIIIPAVINPVIFAYSDFDFGCDFYYYYYLYHHHQVQLIEHQLQYKDIPLLKFFEMFFAYFLGTSKPFFAI